MAGVPHADWPGGVRVGVGLGCGPDGAEGGGAGPPPPPPGADCATTVTDAPEPPDGPGRLCEGLGGCVLAGEEVAVIVTRGVGRLRNCSSSAPARACARSRSWIT